MDELKKEITILVGRVEDRDLVERADLAVREDGVVIKDYNGQMTNHAPTIDPRLLVAWLVRPGDNLVESQMRGQLRVPAGIKLVRFDEAGPDGDGGASRRNEDAARKSGRTALEIDEALDQLVAGETVRMGVAFSEVDEYAERVLSQAAARSIDVTVERDHGRVRARLGQASVILWPPSGGRDKDAYAVFDQHADFHGVVYCYDEGEAVGTVMDHGGGDQRGLEFHAVKLPFEPQQRATKVSDMGDDDASLSALDTLDKAEAVLRIFEDDLAPTEAGSGQLLVVQAYATVAVARELRSLGEALTRAGHLGAPAA